MDLCYTKYKKCPTAKYTIVHYTDAECYLTSVLWEFLRNVSVGYYYPKLEGQRKRRQIVKVEYINMLWYSGWTPLNV